MRAKADWIVFWLALAALAFLYPVYVLAVPFVVLMWFGCPQYNALGGCGSHTLETALPRIAAGLAVLAVVGLVWWLWRKRRKA